MGASQDSRKGQAGMSQRKAALPTQWCEEACPTLLRRNPGTGGTPGLSSGHLVESCMGEASKAWQPLPQLVHTDWTVWEAKQCSQKLQASGGWITYTQKAPPHCAKSKEQGE